MSGLALFALVSASYSSAALARGATETSSSASHVVAAASGRNSTPPMWLIGHDWERIPTKKHVVALTFDAGSNAAGLPSIRHTLRARKVPATFFLTGQWALRHPVRAKALATHYRIGNHSMTHPHFTDLTNRQIRAQLGHAARAIGNICGVSPRPLFRFPYGDRTKRTIAAVNGAGYVAVRWSVDTLGWEGTAAGITVRSVVSKVLANLRPGEIVLMHVGANPDDHSTLDAHALPRVISKLRARGYTFVTLDALLTARKGPTSARHYSAGVAYFDSAGAAGPSLSRPSAERPAGLVPLPLRHEFPSVKLSEEESGHGDVRMAARGLPVPPGAVSGVWPAGSRVLLRRVRL